MSDTRVIAALDSATPAADQDASERWKVVSAAVATDGSHGKVTRPWHSRHSVFTATKWDGVIAGSPDVTT
jgi:hypothetical protein